MEYSIVVAATATYAGIAAGADAILVPERETDLGQVAATIRTRHRHGHTYSIVVVAEGCEAPGGQAVSAGVDAFGFERLGGVGYAFGAGWQVSLFAEGILGQNRGTVSQLPPGS